MKIKIPANIEALMQPLLDKGFQAYVIGGAVRDVLMGIEPHDWDIFTDASGDEILAIFPNGKIIGGEERQAKILTVIVNGVEISQFRSNGNRTETGKNLKIHQSTCDFTINALAANIDGNILDYKPEDSSLKTGLDHIKSRTLIFVGNAEDRIREDPLRLFRGIRFSVKYNLHIHNNHPFVVFKDFVQDLPKERIRDELMKIIVLPHGLERLSQFLMLEWIIPEWENCRGLDGGKHHAEKLGEHMMLAVENAQKLTNNPLLLLAVFMHDIGKAQSMKETEDSVTFYNHQNIGEEYTSNWMKEMRFSQKEIDYVSAIIKHHMMGKTGEITDRTFIGICNELNKAGVAPEDMLVQTFSDNQANKKNPKLTYNEFLINNGFLQRYYQILYSQKGFNANCLEITGHDIMKFGYEGKAIGDIKQKLFDMVCDASIINRRDRLLEALSKIKGEQNE